MSIPLADAVEHERVWVEGLNRGDVSGANRAFAPTASFTSPARPSRCGALRHGSGWSEDYSSRFQTFISRWRISSGLVIESPFDGGRLAHTRDH